MSRQALHTEKTRRQQPQATCVYLQSLSDQLFQVAVRQIRMLSTSRTQYAIKNTQKKIIKKIIKKNNQKKILKKYSKKKIKEGDNNLLLGIPFTAVNSVGFLSPTLPSRQCLYRRQNCSHCLEVGSDQGHTPFQQWTSQRRQGIAGITPLRMLGFTLLDSVLKLRVDRR